MIKDVSISFLIVIIIQYFKTVTFNILLVDKPTFPVVFYWMKTTSFSSQFNGLFILYISKAKPLSLVRGYTDMTINKQEIW